MPKILVHVHLYYQEMWPELKACLQNITTDYDLYVTMVEENEALKADVLSFKLKAHVDLVPNKGFDIAPFIDVLNKVDLNSYDYIIKLHTKRDMPLGTTVEKYNFSGDKWRKYLLKFLDNSKLINKYREAFEKDSKLGMVNNFRVICTHTKCDSLSFQKAFALLKQLKLQTQEYHYVMGTMFMARSKLFEPIKDLNLNSDNFLSHVRGKDVLPYALERLFGYIVCAQGYKVSDPLNSKFYQILEKTFTAVCYFIYRRKLCSDGKMVIKLCKIPVTTKTTRRIYHFLRSGINA